MVSSIGLIVRTAPQECGKRNISLIPLSLSVSCRFPVDIFVSAVLRYCDFAVAAYMFLGDYMSKYLRNFCCLGFKKSLLPVTFQHEEGRGKIDA